MQTQDDAEQVTGGTETARNQHLLAPEEFLLAGIHCKNKTAAGHTSPKWSLTTEVGVWLFFLTFLIIMEILSDVAQPSENAGCSVTSWGGLFTLSWEASG